MNYIKSTILTNKYLITIKEKMITIVILNITDILFTQMLISTGSFIEANNFMKSIVQNPLSSILLKTFIPILLFSLIWGSLSRLPNKQLRIANQIINVGLGMYICINIFHLLWVGTLLMFR
jgi:hypothetical protein